MIFVTVGNHSQPFNRLLQWMDSLVADRAIKVPVFIQRGHSTFEPRFCESEKFIAPDKFIHYMQKCDAIVAHAGTGSVIDSLECGRRPVVVPRLKKYGEHVNDHQVQLAKEFGNRNFVYVAMTQEELLSCVSAATEDRDYFRYVAENQLMRQLVSSFLEEINVRTPMRFSAEHKRGK